MRCVRLHDRVEILREYGPGDNFVAAGFERFFSEIHLNVGHERDDRYALRRGTAFDGANQIHRPRGGAVQIEDYQRRPGGDFFERERGILNKLGARAETLRGVVNFHGEKQIRHHRENLHDFILLQIGWQPLRSLRGVWFGPNHANPEVASISTHGPSVGRFMLHIHGVDEDLLSAVAS